MHDNKEIQYVPNMQGCSDGGCIFEYKRPGTMVTNGGCQCAKELMRSEAGQMAYRTIMWMRSNWPSMPVAVDNSGHSWVPVNTIPARMSTRTMMNKVNMIKEIREKTGSGLRECKEAMDAVYPSCCTFDEVVEKGVQYVLRGNRL